MMRPQAGPRVSEPKTPIVTVSYPRDFVKQQLGYAAIYAVQ